MARSREEKLRMARVSAERAAAWAGDPARHRPACTRPPRPRPNPIAELRGVARDLMRMGLELGGRSVDAPGWLRAYLMEDSPLRQRVTAYLLEREIKRAIVLAGPLDSAQKRGAGRDIQEPV